MSCIYIFAVVGGLWSCTISCKLHKLLISSFSYLNNVFISLYFDAMLLRLFDIIHVNVDLSVV